MKASLILVSLFSALALADSTCQCDEPPMCIQSYPESCICQEKAKEACFRKCGGPIPLLTGCPPLNTTPEHVDCSKQPFCATVHGPLNCECRNAINRHKMACSKIWLPIEDCSALTEPEPQVQARADDAALTASRIPGCLPEPLACTLEGDSCECRNKVRKNKMTCTKIFLELEDCSAPPACECEQKWCIQSWPESCYCANANKEACYQKCGGEKPEMQVCPALPQPTLARAVRSA